MADTGSASASTGSGYSNGEVASFAAQGASSFFGGIAANHNGAKQAKAAKASLNTQARIYDQMGGVSAMTARLYAGMGATYGAMSRTIAGTAPLAIKMGQANAQNTRRAAAQLDRYEQLDLYHARVDARARVAQGRVAFASNGVLVDSGSAAMWEQDENADAALEMLDIMQRYEDQGWQLRTQARQQEAEGYMNASNIASQAAGVAGQGAEAYGQAYATGGQALGQFLQAAELRRQADAIKFKKKWGAVILSAIGTAVGAYFGGPAGAAVGSSVGGSIGGAVDQF